MNDSPAVKHRFRDSSNSAAYVLLKNHLYNYRLRIKAVSGPPPATRIGVSLFKWGNLLFSFAVRLDAKIMPRSMSAVLLIESIRDNDRPVQERTA
jgi:hypothetical protein